MSSGKPRQIPTGSSIHDADVRCNAVVLNCPAASCRTASHSYSAGCCGQCDRARPIGATRIAIVEGIRRRRTADGEGAGGGSMVISLSYSVRISRKKDYIPLPWESILPSREDDPTSPVVEYGLSLEALNERVVAPFTKRGDIRLAGRAILFGEIERIEIRAKGTDSILSRFSHVLDGILGFEQSDTDVTKEFIKDPPAWGPKIGAPERPDAIPVDLLFDRLVTNDALRAATRDRFRTRNFTDAVEAAFKCLANTVKEKSGHYERDGADLMRHVFGARSPQLKLNAFRSQSEKDEHNGYRDIFAGVMTGIRNPRAHEHAIKDDPAVALELLITANHLMRKLDSATKNGAKVEESTP